MSAAKLDKILQTLSYQYEHILGKKKIKNLSFKKIIEYITNYHEDIISAMPGNVYWLDKNCRAVGCNQNVLNMFGLKSIKDFKGLSFGEMAKIGNWTQQSKESFEKDTREVIETGKPKLNVAEPPIPHSDGRFIYFLTSRVPLFDKQGNVVGVVGISIDVTEQRRLESELRIAKEAAECASQAKSIFIANMSHDIRTPLTGIIGMAEAISEEAQDPKIKDYARDVITSSEKLLNLLVSIIETAKSNGNIQPFQTPSFSLKQLIKDLCGLLHPSFVGKQLDFKLHYDNTIPPYLSGNTTLIHRILLNLLSNAIKFTQTGKIILKVKKLKKSKDDVFICFSVKDSGIGIEKNKFDIIFEPFVRLTTSYEGIYQGSGLGLNITKKFVEILGGTIEVKSRLGEGSTFTVILPLAISKNSAIQENSVAKKTSTSNLALLPPVAPNILVVEDDEIASKVISMRLKKLNCNITVVGSGKDAINKIKKMQYDLIYMDIGLSDMTGYETVEQIRLLEKKLKRKEVLIIALTAHVAETEKIKCLKSGMNLIANKPISIETISEHLAILTTAKIESDKNRLIKKNPLHTQCSL